MTAQSFEIIAHNKLLDRECSVAWWFHCLACDHKLGGSIPCQEKLHY